MTKKPSDFNEAAGVRLRLCREALKLTQQAFAADLGISRTVLENWESGDNCPRPVAIERVRLKHGINHDWVYAGLAGMLPPNLKPVVAPRTLEAPAKEAPEKARRRKSA